MLALKKKNRAQYFYLCQVHITEQSLNNCSVIVILIKKLTLVETFTVTKIICLTEPC